MSVIADNLKIRYAVIARFRFKGKGLMFAIVLLQIIVPVQIILIPQYMQFRYFDIFGLFNAVMGDSLMNLPRSEPLR
mgnify:CR=1 FL=1